VRSSAAVMADESGCDGVETAWGRRVWTGNGSKLTFMYERWQGVTAGIRVLTISHAAVVYSLGPGQFCCNGAACARPYGRGAGAVRQAVASAALVRVGGDRKP
jgi:hypothetical protein